MRPRRSWPSDGRPCALRADRPCEWAAAQVQTQEHLQPVPLAEQTAVQVLALLVGLMFQLLPELPAEQALTPLQLTLWCPEPALESPTWKLVPPRALLPPVLPLLALPPPLLMG
mmetsp:Transcript_1421/g.4019  ORF Transcript_1421/g.4019 Transcript_1421/m.4019 type:complete len:114 (+) Transcript_1421:567-908(+)